MQSTRDKIVTFLTDSPNHAAAKRDLLMRTSYRKDFQQVYDMMVSDRTIEEYGFGTRSNPRMVTLTFQTVQALPDNKPIQTHNTRQRIGMVLVNTKDHQISRREIRMRLRYLPDFQVVYQSMLEQGIITETGSGRKGSTKLVRLLAPGRALSD